MRTLSTPLSTTVDVNFRVLRGLVSGHLAYASPKRCGVYHFFPWLGRVHLTPAGNSPVDNGVSAKLRCKSVPMRSRAGVRDQLNPATRVLWRGEHTIQLELGDRRLILDGITPYAVRSLTWRGPIDELNPGLSTVGDPLAGVRGALEAHGFLWRRYDVEDDPRLAPPTPRLSTELGELTSRRGDHAAAVLNARRRAVVAIHGTGRVGPLLAAILAAAGVGRVYATDTSEARLHQQQPGGLGSSDEGVAFNAATAAAIRRNAPETDTTPLPLDERPDLVVLAVDEPIEDDRRDALHAFGWTHLPVSVTSNAGVVGPLVIPGASSCLRCADLYRLDRDPAWNAIAVQLATPRRPRDGSSVALASTIAGVAAAQALAFLDGEDPATIEGTLEVHSPDWRIRRRTRPHHPDCDCIPPAVD